MLDRIEVWGVAGQMDRACAGGLDQLAHAGRLVRGEFVEDDHVTRAKLGLEALLDERLEDRAVIAPRSIIGAMNHPIVNVRVVVHDRAPRVFAPPLRAARALHSLRSNPHRQAATIAEAYAWRDVALGERKDRARMNDERDGLEALRTIVLGATIALVRTDAAGRGSGFAILWKGDVRVVSARHVLDDGEWAVEAADTSRSAVTEANVRETPPSERRTLLLRLAADRASFAATPHDIAWAAIDVDRQRLRGEPEAPHYVLPLYRGPLDQQPEAGTPYAFFAANRDEHHLELRVVRREVAAEAYMEFVGADQDAFRFRLARPHRGDAFYKGASGAPIVDPSGAIMAILVGPGGPNELRAASVAQFIRAMQALA